MLQQELEETAELDAIFHGLADPTRRAIVEHLKQGEAAVSTLAQPFAMSLSAVVQHIQILEASGLVRTEKHGRVRICRVDTDRLEYAQAWFASGKADTPGPRAWQPDIPPVDHVRQGVFCLD